MFNVKIYGAGSVGNHYAYAFRRRSWNVKVFDTDHKALIRMKEMLYPNRYGKWDSKISLTNKDDNDNPCLFSPGDIVKFKPISKEEYKAF